MLPYVMVILIIVLILCFLMFIFVVAFVLIISCDRHLGATDQEESISKVSYVCSRDYISRVLIYNLLIYSLNIPHTHIF